MTTAATSRWRSVDGHDQACTSCSAWRRVEEPAWTGTPQHGPAQRGPPSHSPGGAQQSQRSRLMFRGAQAEAGEHGRGADVSPVAPVTGAVVGSRADRPAGPHHRPVSQLRLQNGRQEQQHLSRAEPTPSL